MRFFHFNKNTIAFTAIILIELFLICCQNDELQEEVTINVESVSLSKSIITLSIGESDSVFATIEPSAAKFTTINWSSSDSSIASVNDGIITAISKGKATITACADDKKATCSVNVIVPVSSVTLNNSSIELIEGDTITLNVTIEPSDASDATINWASSNDTVASVSKGLVTALRVGTTTITANIGDRKDSCLVTVNKKIIHVDSVTTNVTQKRLKKGEKFLLETTISPNNANNYSITYRSENREIASIDNDGLITGVASGKTKIYIEAEDEMTEVVITVFEKDVIYATAHYYKNNAEYYTVWKDSDVICTPNYAEGKYDFFSSYLYRQNNTPIIIGLRPTTYSGFCIIRDGVSQKVIIGEGNNWDVRSTAQDGYDIYTLMSGFYRNYNTNKDEECYCVYKNSNKLYDFGEDSKISQYSLIRPYSKIFYYNGDTYVGGYIQEPINETEKTFFATIWKNGKIYKQFDVRGFDYQWENYLYGDDSKYCYIADIAVVNGHMYYLIAVSDHYAHNQKLTLYDDNGFVCDYNIDAKYSTGKLYPYEDKLYAAVTASYENQKMSQFHIYEDGNLLYTIPNSSGAINIIDGDIYALVKEVRLWGGDQYSSLCVFRGEYKEYTLSEEPFVAASINVLNER